MLVLKFPNFADSEICKHWKIPLTEEPGWLQSMGSQRVGHNWATSVSIFDYFDSCFLEKQIFLGTKRASQVVLVIKNLPANARGIRDAGSIPELGRSPGGGHGNPLLHSCLENSMDRGAWWATVHRITKSQTRLKRLSTQSDWKWTKRWS